MPTRYPAAANSSHLPRMLTSTMIVSVMTRLLGSDRQAAMSGDRRHCKDGR